MRPEVALNRHAGAVVTRPQLDRKRTSTARSDVVRELLDAGANSRSRYPRAWILGENFNRRLAYEGLGLQVALVSAD